MCTGKGSHGVATTLLKMKKTGKLLQKRELPISWCVFITFSTKSVLYSRLHSTPQSTANPHYLWHDIQLCKSGWNKDREVDVFVSDKNETLMYRIASCNGVKLCLFGSCDHVAPISAQRPCSMHSQLVKSNDEEPCPVQFAYLYPKDASDHR